ncbi:hypothetical protein F5Y19DRAFT_438977 [Xylariaceae sp. FL1651]|nr:hypothetical protein F5Y19DRAFT_438977 [Xylariaceae sp. FL1651]
MPFNMPESKNGSLSFLTVFFLFFQSRPIPSMISARSAFDGVGKAPTYTSQLVSSPMLSIPLGRLTFPYWLPTDRVLSHCTIHSR